MCARINLVNSSELDQMMEYLGIASSEVPNYINTGPAENYPIIIQNNKKRALTTAIWWFSLEKRKAESGYKPNNKVTSFNARCENLKSSRLWHTSFQFARCIVPVSGYFESGQTKIDKTGNRFYLRPQTNALALAGIYKKWPDIQDTYSFAVITTDAHPKLQHIHHRQPVMMTPEYVESWLDSSFTDIEHFEGLFNSKLCQDLELMKIDKKYSKAALKDRGCMDPIGDIQQISKD